MVKLHSPVQSKKDRPCGRRRGGFLPSVWGYDGVKYILENNCVPPKIRELISMLESAGFENRGGKGSHRNFKHSQGSTSVTVSGQLGDDAKHYLIKAVKIALENSRNENN